VPVFGSEEDPGPVVKYPDPVKNPRVRNTENLDLIMNTAFKSGAMQEGKVGVINAADNHDPDHGATTPFGRSESVKFRCIHGQYSTGFWANSIYSILLYF